MIDIKTGAISFDGGWSVTGGGDEATFAAASANHSTRSQQTFAQHVRHSLRGVSIGGTQFNATFIFATGKLESISLALPSSASGWDSWSEADEKQRKVDHDKWLATTLGPPPYDYPWGTISSQYSPQSAASTITFRYR